MKLKDGAVITDVTGSKVLVDAGTNGECFHGIIRLNETAALMAEKLQSGAALEDLINILTSEYDIDTETAKADIETFLDQLRGTGMLED